MTARPHRRLKIRFIAVTCEEAFFDPVKRGIADAARQMDVDWDFTGTRGTDVAEMVALAREALAQRYDGLAIDMFVAEPFRVVIAEATAQGVPVVAFNIDAGDGAVGNLSSVTQDFFAAGHKLGAAVRKDIPPGSKVLVTRHDEGISALDARRDGIVAALAERDVHIVEAVTGHLPDVAAQAVGAILRQSPEITAILATGQADTEAAGLVSAAMGGRRIVAGFDLSDRILRLIEDGVIRFTLDQQPYVQGFYPVVQLALRCRFGIMPASLDAGASVIDRGNVADVRALTAAGYR